MRSGTFCPAQVQAAQYLQTACTVDPPNSSWFNSTIKTDSLYHSLLSSTLGPPALLSLLPAFACRLLHSQEAGTFMLGAFLAAAYHHFGMISPFKVARDLNSNSSNGARKFFDEFMTWRELSYAFCFQHWPDLESVQVCLCSLTSNPCRCLSVFSDFESMQVCLCSLTLSHCRCLQNH